MAKRQAFENKCILEETDRQGQTNLCCCYVMDEKGNYQNPCFTPVTDCCFSARTKENDPTNPLG